MTTQNDANGITNLWMSTTCTTLESGDLTATVRRTKSLLFRTDYNFTLESERGNPVFPHDFSASDVPDLARLALMLACAISADETVEPRLRDDLGCLAACLEEVLPRT